MQKKVWIGLEGMEFYAFHGVYPEERKIGGVYIVDVWVYTDTSKAQLEDVLSGTVNYEQLYVIVRNHMQEPVQLIEHLARKIIDDTRLLLQPEDKIRIKIKKQHPPLGKRVEASIVEIED